MKHLGNSLKSMKNNLEYLVLNLSRNSLGNNLENLRHLGDSLKQLDNLKHLELDLENNGLGEN